MSEFIPKQYQYIATTIRLSSHKLDLINSMAAKHNISRNEFINQCIDFALEMCIRDSLSCWDGAVGGNGNAALPHT